MLMARFRRAGWSKMLTMMPKIMADSSAAPMPCTKRNDTSSTAELDKPQKSEAAVKTPNPAMNTCLRPSRSPSRPATKRQAPRVSR